MLINFFLKTFNIFSIFSAVGILLGTTSLTPTWAMDAGETYEHTLKAPQHHISYFNYDLTRLELARQVVAQAAFLPEEVRSWFEICVKTYDRRQFLDLLTPGKQEEFLAQLLSKEKSPITEEVRKILTPDLIQQLEKSYLESRKSQHQQEYKPYFDNIEQNIHEKGPHNYALFDAFFYMILGVGDMGVLREKTGKQEDVYNLLLQLEEVNFLKNFNTESLTRVKEICSPLEQFNRFHKNKRQEVTTLVIAGGHIGRKDMESISQYKNTLAIDLMSSQVPDIVADINDEKLLEVLLDQYKAHFHRIYDTSNIVGFRGDTFMDKKTIGALVGMLRPGGRLMQQASWDKDPFLFDESTIQNLETYGLVPIYSGNEVIALEKPH